MNPASVLADFSSLVNELHAFHARVENILTSKKDISTLSEATALRLAVIWEGFVSDLFVAYINRDCTVYSSHLKSAFESEFSGKQEAIFSKFGNLDFPAHMDRNTVLGLVDRRDQNITFLNAVAMKDQAKKWLVAGDALRFHSLDSRDRAVINLLVSIRNHLAHRSKGSLDRMNDLMASAALHSTGLRRENRGISNVGSYLKAYPGPLSRIGILISEIQRVAAKI